MRGGCVATEEARRNVFLRQAHAGVAEIERYLLVEGAQAWLAGFKPNASRSASRLTQQVRPQSGQIGSYAIKESEMLISSDFWGLA